jgi:hypothetical protein
MYTYIATTFFEIGDGLILAVAPSLLNLIQRSVKE